MICKVLTTIRCHQAFGLMLFIVATLSGCASHEDAPEPVVIEKPTEPEPISLLFACAPASPDRAMTRLADKIVQLNELIDNEKYRNITNFRVIAQTKDGNGGVIITDSWVDNPGVVKDNTTSRFYHSGYCNMTEGVNACLVYAKADDATPPAGVSKKVYNGSLKPEITMIPTYVSSTRRLSFDLNPIIEDATVGGDGIPTAAWTLANALTDIVDESHNNDNTLVWKTSTNVILRNLFQRFTNSSADLPGSAASVKQWMLSLSAAANTYLTNPPSTVGEDDIKLLQIIKDKADAKAATVTGDYPRGINLPDGAAALRWTVVEKLVGEETVKEQKFVPQMHTTTLDNINSVSRFVYPPALYYFVDSNIWTSNEKVEENDYKSKSRWEGNGDDAVQKLFDGSAVSSTTKSVAVADPLQYAVAHLTMEVKAGAASLPYGVENKTIDISKLTLKGVIIGGQRPVNYQFVPVSNSEYDVKFVYDSQVNNGETPAPLSETSATYHTLVLQSYDDEDVNVILEFQYSDAEGTEGFKCLNGYVYPGTRFYLVGEVKAKDYRKETGDANSRGRVFTQDYTTTIEMTVNSLEKAYNVLPSLLSNSLEIGVMITPQWFSATPSDPVVMD